MSTPTTALWFSRHLPTSDQLEEIAREGFTLDGEFNGHTILSLGQALGAHDIRDRGDVYAVGQGLLGLAESVRAERIYGVWPTPVLGVFPRVAVRAVEMGAWPAAGAMPCYAAWNVARPVEGGKPTFAHREWVLVGVLHAAALRWYRA